MNSNYNQDSDGEHLNELHQKLESIYYDTSNPAGYSSLPKLYIAAKKALPTHKFYISDVKRWLESQDSYSRHKRTIKNFNKNPVIAYHIDEQWQGDLADVRNLSHHNGGAKFILIIIDVLSRFSWARALRNKDATSTKLALQNIVHTSGRKPNRVYVDPGKEFLGGFKKYITDDLKADIYYSDVNKKAHLAERQIYTLKLKMYKYFTANKTKRYIDQLQNFMDAYNYSIHSRLRMRPADVTAENERLAFNNLFGSHFDIFVKDNYTRIDPKITKQNSSDKDIQVGDSVRVVLKKGPFSKGATPNYSASIYKVVKKLTSYAGSRVKFIITDDDGNPFPFQKYSDELVKCDPNPQKNPLMSKIQSVNDQLNLSSDSNINQSIQEPIARRTRSKNE